MINLYGLIKMLESPRADKVYVAYKYTKADLIRDLNDLLGSQEPTDPCPCDACDLLGS